MFTYNERSNERTNKRTKRKNLVKSLPDQRSVIFEPFNVWLSSMVVSISCIISLSLLFIIYFSLSLCVCVRVYIVSILYIRAAIECCASNNEWNVCEYLSVRNCCEQKVTNDGSGENSISYELFYNRFCCCMKTKQFFSPPHTTNSCHFISFPSILAQLLASYNVKPFEKEEEKKTIQFHFQDLHFVASHNMYSVVHTNYS